MKEKRKEIRNQFFIYVALTMLLMLSFIPVYVMFITSWKDFEQYFHNFWTLSLPLHGENYVIAWKVVSKYIFNSLIYSGSSAMGATFLATISAYIFARYSFKGKEVLFYLILSLLMLPAILLLIPQFLVVRNLGLLNTRWALIIPFIATQQVIAIFVLRTFFASIPEELLDSARIDGASILQVYRHIILPLSIPIIVTMAMIVFVNTWNEIIWPLVTISSDELKPITTGLITFQQYTTIEYGPLLAGCTIASVPLVLLFCFGMRYYVQGITAGALKV